MRNEGDRPVSGLVMPQLKTAERVLRDGKLVVIDRSLTLGYDVILDKRVRKPKVRSTRIILMTPRDVQVVEHGKRGSQVHKPFEETDTHKATGIYINSSQMLLSASSDYLFNLQRRTQSYGAKHLELTVASPNPGLEVLMHPGEEIDVSSLAGHLAALNTAPAHIKPTYI